MMEMDSHEFRTRIRHFDFSEIRKRVFAEDGHDYWWGTWESDAWEHFCRMAHCLKRAEIAKNDEEAFSLILYKLPHPYQFCKKLGKVLGHTWVRGGKLKGFRRKKRESEEHALERRKKKEAAFEELQAYSRIYSILPG